ncbi:sugar phosphate isomerase/epimerase [Streptomyces sp. NBC_00280]
MPFFLHPRADDDRIARLKNSLRTHGVRVSSVLPLYRWSSPDETERQTAVRYWKRMIEIAADLECPLMNSEFNGRPDGRHRGDDALRGRQAPARAHRRLLQPQGLLGPALRAGPRVLGVHARPDPQGARRVNALSGRSSPVQTHMQVSFTMIPAHAMRQKTYPLHLRKYHRRMRSRRDGEKPLPAGHP